MNESDNATVTDGRAYAGKSLTERRRERRAKFVEAGVTVFGREGFRAATVKGLCRQAGLTERYFYESFANSEALFAEVYSVLMTDLKDNVVAALDAAPPEPEAAARAALRVFLETMYHQPGTARIVLIEIFGISGEIDRLYRSTTREYTRLLQDVVSAIFPLERIPGADADVLSTGLVGSTVHIAMYWTLSDYHEPLDTVVESSLALYVAIARQLADD